MGRCGHAAQNPTLTSAPFAPTRREKLYPANPNSLTPVPLQGADPSRFYLLTASRTLQLPNPRSRATTASVKLERGRAVGHLTPSAEVHRLKRLYRDITAPPSSRRTAFLSLNSTKS